MQPVSRDILEQSVIDILNVGSLPESQQVALVEQVLTLAQQRITVRILESLDEANRTAFFDALEIPDEDAMAKIIAHADVDMPVVIIEEVMKIKKELLDHATAATAEQSSN